MCRSLGVTILLLHVFVLSGQLKTPLDSLLLACDSLVSERKKILLDDLKAQSRFNFLNYVPSLGYDFYNHRPLITYNFSEIARLLNDKEKKNQKIRSIDGGAELDLQQLHKNVTIRHLRLTDLFYTYDIELEIYRFKRELYNFDIMRYKNNEIPMEAFFKSEIEIREFQKKILSIRDQIYTSIIELESLTNYSLNYEIKELYPIGLIVTNTD